MFLNISKSIFSGPFSVGRVVDKYVELCYTLLKSVLFAHDLLPFGDNLQFLFSFNKGIQLVNSPRDRLVQ